MERFEAHDIELDNHDHDEGESMGDKDRHSIPIEEDKSEMSWVHAK